MNKSIIKVQLSISEIEERAAVLKKLFRDVDLKFIVRESVDDVAREIQHSCLVILGED